ncbi:MAG TPA: hypothetical protein VNO26_09650 [Candidatus Limnocylindria bacterium]|nr:hypothetical protein [Candidatus Limnocylindria bacterium]
MNDDAIVLTRRTLLRWAAGGTFALAMRAGLVEGSDAADDGDVAAALTRIGRRYLEGTPDERDLPTLQRRLGAWRTPDEVLDNVAALERAVRRDFERGDILAVDGWILSRTELRAAALFALTASRP